jgi:large subunit ribosomal protein L4
LSIDAPKTSVVAGILKSLGLDETTCLLVIDAHDLNIWKSSRNIPNLAVAAAGNLNAYDLLHQRQMIVTKSALDSLRKPKSN